jgi:GNAT superfamily N-acetyltransferase
LITFSFVDPEYGAEAYQAHADFTAEHDAVRPRTREEFLEIVENGFVWAAADLEGLVGLAYAAFDPDRREWEIGGLMVLARARKRGIGAILMQLALGSVLFNEDPLLTQPDARIVAHVLRRNEMPRRIIEDVLRFHHSGSATLDPELAPTMPVEDDGLIHGDEFELTVPDTLEALISFCEGWSGRLLNDEQADIEMFEETDLHLWARQFRLTLDQLRDG